MARMDEVRYRYAADAAGRVVDVQTLTAADRADYRCFSCGEALRPVLGQVRQQHFRHRSEQPCAAETYLHRLGKALFVQEYRRCVDSGFPFTLVLRRPRECGYCPSGPCVVGTQPWQYDLAASFPQVAVEQSWGPWVPDVTLTSGQYGAVIFVEFAVTHACAPEKIASGERIIELPLRSEADLAPVRHHRLGATAERELRLYNFRPRPQRGDYSAECVVRVPVLLLYADGRGESAVYPAAHWEREVAQQRPCYYQRLARSTPEAYVQALEQLYVQGHLVKNCYLCRHHRFKGSLGNVVYCQRYKRDQLPSYAAVSCSHYRPDRRVFTFYPVAVAAPSQTRRR